MGIFRPFFNTPARSGEFVQDRTGLSLWNVQFVRLGDDRFLCLAGPVSDYLGYLVCMSPRRRDLRSIYDNKIPFTGQVRPHGDRKFFNESTSPPGRANRAGCSVLYLARNARTVEAELRARTPAG